MAEFASRGVGNAGLTTGIIGTSLGALSALGGLAGMAGVGGRMGMGYTQPYGNGGGENQLISRYELEQAQKLAKSESDNALKDAKIAQDASSLELYRYIDGKLIEFEKAFAAQAVQNQRTEDSFALVAENVNAVRSDLVGRIKLEAERRSCGDNAIVNYSNATFYPKMVADVTTGTTTTAQTLYNPIPVCDCDCDCNS